MPSRLPAPPAGGGDPGPAGGGDPGPAGGGPPGPAGAGPPGVAGFEPIGRCRVTGVLNVTPDSFSDGGAWLDTDVAVAHGLRMWRQGADLVDVGGESTRPGAGRVEEAEERRRVVPVVAALAASGVPVSVDTVRAATARAALAAGACLVNDVSGGQADPAMLELVAQTGVPYVIMHWRGPSRDMQARAEYADVVADVVAELSDRVAAAVRAGVAREQVILDPGLGFGKTATHNWQILARLAEITALGRPVLVGASRKSFLGALLAAADGTPRPTDKRDDATHAITAIAAVGGAWGVRVHAVPASRDAVAVAAAVRRAAP